MSGGRARLEAVERRITALEKSAAKASHEHTWLYGKVIGGSADTFVGRWVMWTWECTGSDVCGMAKTSTNTRSHVPDHFPADLA